MPSRRRWLQFSLRGLLALLTVFAIWLGFIVNRIREQREALETIEAMGADVRYEYDETADRTVSPWLKSLYGDLHALKGVRVAVLQSVRPSESSTEWFFSTEGRSGWFGIFNPDITFDDRGLMALGKLKTVDDVLIMNVPVTDAGLMHLASCVRLRRLALVGTSVSASGVAALQAKLPHCEIYFSPSSE
ncbi:MAG TPA: hypothetical protein VMV10_12625 [Pirellulales bacterium]|nr:hypothetical protein [Pirellulales bacterium]